MKIVHICLNGTVTDGFSYQDNLLPKFHKELGNEVVVIASLYSLNTNAKLVKLSKEIMKYKNEYGITVYRIPNILNTNDKSKFKRYINFISILEQESPDIIFLHDFQLVDSKQVIRYVKRHKKVIVYADNHADYSNSARNWLSKNILHKIIWRHYARKLNPYVKKFYGVTPARVDFLTDLYKLPKEKCELLVMGADNEFVEKSKTTNSRKAIRDKYKILDDDFLIVTGGKIDLEKKQTILLMEAVKKIDNPKVKLIVFGSVVNELKPKIEELTHGCDNVLYVGWISSEQSYDYFEAADLVVFPGRHSVFWEQVVGQGKPMIVKYWDGTTHVDLGGNVEFLYNDSVEEIEKKLLCVMQPTVISKMKEVAEQEGMQMFSYKEIARRSIELNR
ncbi:MAG TPA: glycosyl transferase family 1 [Clostridiales bacterium]|nr:glycosyl transferase family 1 [Clostridiales bacterium]